MSFKQNTPLLFIQMKRNKTSLPPFKATWMIMINSHDILLFLLEYSTRVYVRCVMIRTIL
jgi:hypothetical protein